METTILKRKSRKTKFTTRRKGKTIGVAARKKISEGRKKTTEKQKLKEKSENQKAEC